MTKSGQTIGMIGARGISTDQIGGIEAVVTELTKALATSCFRFNVYIRKSVAPYRETNKYIRLIKIARLPTKHLDTFSYSIFASIHASFSCQVVHYHGVGPAMMCWLPRIAGKRVIVTIHGADWRRDKWNSFAKLSLLFCAWIVRFFAHDITAVSQPCADETSKVIGRRVICIPNGLLESQLQENEEYCRNFDIKKNGYYLFLGRLVPEKRVDLLLNAFRNLKTDKNLVVAGSAPYGSIYQKKLKYLAAMDSRVLMVGFVSGALKEGLLSNAYCLILPSMIEGHAMVILEAVNKSVPVLCSSIPENLFAICASGDQIDAVSTGLIFQAGNQDALQKSMEIAEAQPNMLKMFSVNAKKLACIKFNWQEIIRQYKALYERP